ncbi:MAG: hypothetical protein ACJAYU_002997 [Bradymonadia bacterium]|jgi:hypothetical protein
MNGRNHSVRGLIDKGVSLAVLGVISASCGGRQVTAELIMEHVDPGTLVPIEQMPVEFMMRQTVTATWGEEEDEQSFEAVLQQRAGVLTIIAISPIGQPGFIVTWDGESASMENHTDRELPFPAEFMISDVQRVFYPWLAAGETTGEMFGLQIAEVWTNGELATRSFTRLDEDGEPSTLLVEFEDWGDIAPARATLHSWYGYDLVIDTYEENRLE